MGFGEMGFGFDSPFAMQGSNATAATRRGPGIGGDEAFGSTFTPFSATSTIGSMMAAATGGSFQSESTSTRTVNGRTETVIRKVDGQGNETFQTITPESQRFYVNGIEQQNHPSLQAQKGNRPPLEPRY
jgi:DnaJ family protein B protein 6